MASRDSNRPAAGRSWLTILCVVALAAVWGYRQYRAYQEGGGTRPAQPRSEAPARPGPPARPQGGERSAPPKPETPATTPRRQGGYEVYQNCVLVEARNNDGDSFMIRLPDGRQKEMRLYFVDTPESAFKRYAGGETNHERIRQQAADLGGVTPEQAVEIGKKGKAFTLALLESAPFTIYTVWDSPYSDNRYHAFVEVRQSGRVRWLHELLIERGFARLKTKPGDLPDGTRAEVHRQHLRELESVAKRARAGVWGL